MGKIFKFLGMSVAVATDNMLNIERRVPFAADVTYVTAQVLCFTYLFDNTTQTKDYTVSFAFAADMTCGTAHKCCVSCICTTIHISNDIIFVQQYHSVTRPTQQVIWLLCFCVVSVVTVPRAHAPAAGNYTAFCGHWCHHFLNTTVVLQVTSGPFNHATSQLLVD